MSNDLTNQASPVGTPRIGLHALVSCRCGCGQPAQYFFTGTDYGGEPITEEPCCYTAMLYLRDSSIEAGLSWKVRPAANSVLGDTRRTVAAIGKS